MQGYPARLVAHYLYHHHPLVCTGRAVQAVYGIGSNAHGRVEAEAAVRSPDVVVNGLGHRHDVQPHVGQPGGCFLRSVAAYAHQAVQTQLLHVAGYQGGFVHIRHHSASFERLFARCTQYCSPHAQQSGQRFVRHLFHLLGQ